MRWVAWFLVVACNKEAPQQAPLVGQTRALVDKLCACTDAACADAIAKEWEALPANQTLTDADIDALANEQQRFAKCLAEIRR